MRKLMLVAALAVAATAFGGGTASAQSGLVEVGNPGPVSLSGDIVFRIKDSQGNTSLSTTCDLAIDGTLNAYGDLSMTNWDPTGGSGPGLGDCGAFGHPAWDDCGGAGFMNHVVPPGTEWSVAGDLPSVYADWCFSINGAWYNTGWFPLLQIDGTSWTSEETVAGLQENLTVELDLVADTEFEISEIEE